MKEDIDTMINLAETVRSTLGPKGMNKLVVSTHPIMTNDGATIIKNLKHPHPLFEVLKNLAISQEKSIGDGTTTTCIILAELLKNAKILLDKGVHPITIIQGYNMSRHACIHSLQSAPEITDNELSDIILTTFGAKISRESAEHLKNIILKNRDEYEFYLNENSDPLDTEIIDGYVFDAYTINDQMPSQAEGNVVCMNMRTNTELAKFQITSSDELKKINDQITDKKQEIVNELIKNDVKCLFVTDINPEFESMLTRANIMTIVLYDMSKIHKICKCTGASLVSNVNEIGSSMGKSEIIFTKNPNRIKLSGKMKTMFLCGSTKQTLEETKLAIDDVMGVLKSKQYVYGGGAVELELARLLNQNAASVDGREQIAVVKFAEALESLPMTLAANCGFDQVEVLSRLRSMHSQGKATMGVDPLTQTSCAKQRNLIEPAEVKINAINNATELANLVLKLDGVYQGEDDE